MYAKSWNDVEKALRRSTSSTSMDELIYLVQQPRVKGVLPKLSGVRNVMIACRGPEVVDIILKRPTVLRADAAEFKPRVASKDEDDEDKAAEKELAPVVEDGPPPDASLLAQEIELVKHQESSAASEQATSAAEVIQAQWKRTKALRDRQASAEGPLLFWAKCMEASKTMDFPYPHYRVLFLGPLPHMLSCLFGLHDLMNKYKKKIKKKYGTTDPQQLMEAALRISHAKYVQRSTNIANYQ